MTWLDNARDIDAARLGQSLEPRRNIDAITKHIAVLGNDVAEINADPQREAPLGRKALVFCQDGLADRNGAARRLNDALKFNERQVAGLLEQVTVVLAVSGWMVSVKTTRRSAIRSTSSPGNSRL